MPFNPDHEIARDAQRRRQLDSATRWTVQTRLLLLVAIVSGAFTALALWIAG